VQTSFFIVTIRVALIATSMLAQSVGTGPKVVLKEIHFRGELGLPVSELRDYTEYLIGHPMEQAKILEEAQSAVGNGLRHRGYWKAQVTPPQIHLLQRSVNSKNKEVALELAIKAGRQYRVKE